MEEVEVEVIETREEWETLQAAELAKLGVTYEELAEQARRGDFSCEDARWVWLAVGGHRDLRQREDGGRVIHLCLRS